MKQSFASNRSKSMELLFPFIQTMKSADDKNLK